MEGPMLNCGYEAYSFLDYPNQREVLWHIENWKYELPEAIKEYEEKLKELENDYEEKTQ